MKPTVFSEIKSAAEVNLNAHAVIEASAGTGKTYTLIELVMRMLLEQRLTIDKLLLVTFTEQATGELKARIRQRLWDELEQSSHDEVLSAHLEHNLAQLNQASIFTIHGFCHGALKEFAFEQGAVFEAEVVNDSDVWTKILSQMKRSWPADQALLKLIKTYTASKSISTIDDLLLKLAAKYKPEFDAIYPFADVLNDTALWKTLNDIDVSNMTALEKELSQLNGATIKTLQSRWKDKIEPFLLKLKDLQNSIDNKLLMTFLSQYGAGLNDGYYIEKYFFNRLPKVYDDQRNDSERAYNLQVAPQLFLLLTQINQLLNEYAVLLEGQKFQAIPALLNQLVRLSQQHKLDRGLISYDDMIMLLWQQLTKEQSLSSSEQLLTHALRNKYQVAIIDEFQDTDIRQWGIFKHLFLMGNEANSDSKHCLWVIGDPKQAIYGFRGADLHTYEAAKMSIIENYQGHAYRLGTNYRTDAGLIAQLNRFFADDTGRWFAPEEVHVKAAVYSRDEVKNKPQVIEKNKLNYFNCLTVDCADALTSKSQLAEKIAVTIKHQIIDKVEVQLKGQQRKLNASDVCILVRGNKDAEFIEDALQKRSIPFTFHKKKNLYQSTEAIHFHVLLTALARPNDNQRVNNALLTLFFDLQPAQLDDFAAEQLPHITNLWLKTKEAVLAKDWIKVFDLMLDESGALFRARKNSRRIANIKQLTQRLLQAALQNNLGAAALLKFYQQKRTHSSSDEDLHHKDTEQNAVKIMTMHISKGLEFPVVFLFGGFGHADNDVFLQYYDENQKCMVYDLLKKHKSVYEAQQIKAAHQLYYVAMTRAIFMLFLPFVDEKDKKIDRPGLYVKTVMSRLKASDMFQLSLPDIEDSSNEIQASHSEFTLTEFKLKVPEDLYIRRRNIHSFSSLSHTKSHAGPSTVANDFTQSLTVELMSTEKRIDVDPTKLIQPQIPGGVKTGHVLHGIFEHVSFNRVQQHNDVSSVYLDEAIMETIDQQMKLFKLDNKVFDEVARPVDRAYPLDYRQQFAAWVWHTLKKPLSALNGQNLGAVSAENRSHELSFFWNHDSTYLTGFIDLFFAVPNAQTGEITDYYILDWKSNYSSNGYSPQVLSEEVMAKHQYHWQYQLYAMAMQHWFDSMELKNARLKGAIYVFSRGVDCKENNQNGIFFDDFSDKQWQTEDIKTELLHIDRFGSKR